MVYCGCTGAAQASRRGSVQVASPLGRTVGKCCRRSSTASVAGLRSSNGPRRPSGTITPQSWVVAPAPGTRADAAKANARTIEESGLLAYLRDALRKVERAAALRSTLLTI